MKTELYLVRHGETHWNILGKFQGCSDISLTDTGIRQAELLKERFNNNFDYIYTSPLGRAQQTAGIICQDNTTTKPVIVQDMREINFGEWEGLTIHQIKEQFPSEYHTWRTNEEQGNLVGGDLSIKNASIRAKNAILDIAKQHPGKRIIIVAHGGIFKAGLIGLFDWKMTMYQSLNLDNTSVTKILLIDNTKPILYSFNDVSHLPME